MKEDKPAIERDIGVVALLAILTSRTKEIDVQVKRDDIVVSFRNVDADLKDRVLRAKNKFFNQKGDNHK